MTRRIGLLAAAAALLLLGGARTGLRAAQGQPLQILFIDVEGGAATLLVTPAGESVLIDCGWPGNDDRDPRRIQRAAQLAGVSRIDHFVTTHWHVDHYGGLAGLATLMPIGRFYNRGIPMTLQEDATNFPRLIAAYTKASGGVSTTLKPGDLVPLRAVDAAGTLELKCLAASGEVTPANAGTTPNAECSAAQPMAADATDNARSITLRLSYGPFRFLDCGDLTWNVEQKLVCPDDRIGKIDLYQVTHHGSDSSNNPVLLRTVRPRVAVINNGPRKGGSKAVYAALKATPGMEKIFQLHRNVETTDADNAPEGYIANTAERCEGRMVRADVAPGGRRYTVYVEGKPTRETFQTR